MSVVAPEADIVREARRVLDAATGLRLRLLGGLAIAVSLDERPLLPRPYNDIDFITARGEGPKAAKLFESLGYDGDRQFNGLNGHRRLLFYDRGNERRVDVFVGRFEMCHMWPLERRLGVTERTIPLADLLLTKLQIFAVNEKDQRDILNLVHGHKLTEDESGINVGYIATLCAADWGLWRTVTMNIERARAVVRDTGGDRLMRFGRGRRDEGAKTVTLFYASDIHGSDLLWRKFLGASKFYGADAALMGGDLLGKAIIPIERTVDGTFRAHFLGDDRIVGEGQELDELVGAIRFNGYYPWIATGDEIAERAEDTEELFAEVAREDVRRWVELAEQRMNGASRLYVIAGNDDPWYVDEILSASPAIEFCDDRVVRVGPHEMISSSYANPTPWNSPRELDEGTLYERLKRLADQLEDPHSAIFNLHVPPYDSRLDSAPELKPDLTPRYAGGAPVIVPVGSHAVRQLIEEVQPLVALHGHIHESKGETRIGRTLAINSGSEYNTGRLHGVVVSLGEDRVVSHQFVVG